MTAASMREGKGIRASARFRASEIKIVADQRGAFMRLITELMYEVCSASTFTNRLCAVF